MSSWISQLGDFNPQFLRECRGRLKPRSVMAAIGLSILFQLLLCFSITEGFRAGGVAQLLDIHRALTWIIPYALFAVGGYYIVDDLTQEAKSGTLNFIRLSPRPAREILLGKLLGAPVLPLLLVLTAMPLHIVMGLITGLSPWLLVSYYLIIAFGTLAVFVFALLAGLSSGASSILKQRGVSAIAFAGVCLFAIIPVFMLWNSQVTWQTVPTGPMLFQTWGSEPVEWFYLDIATNTLFSHLFVIGNLAIVSLLGWLIAVRKFRIPQSTLLSKQLSYIVVAYCNLVGWGFILSRILSSSEQLDLTVMLYICNVGLFFVLIFALAPGRQTLLDWVSYQTKQQSRQGVPIQSAAERSTAAQKDRPQWRSWIWADGSPSLVAIAINFVIVAAVLIPATILFTRAEGIEIALAAIVFTTASFGVSALTYAAIVQVIFSKRLRAPQIWAAGAVAVLAIVPPLVLLSLQIFPASYNNNEGAGYLWTFLGVPFIGDAATSVSLLALVGLFGQLCFLGLLLTMLGQGLKKLSAQSMRQSAIARESV